MGGSRPRAKRDIVFSLPPVFFPEWDRSPAAVLYSVNRLYWADLPGRGVFLFKMVDEGLFHLGIGLSAERNNKVACLGLDVVPRVAFGVLANVTVSTRLKKALGKSLGWRKRRCQ